jgi:ubiquitin-protein ligase
MVECGWYNKGQCIKFIYPEDIACIREEWILALPKAMLKTRLINEIQLCKTTLIHEIKVRDPEFSKYPATVLVTMKNVPGPKMNSNRLGHNYTHRIRIDIPEEYPYQKPTVRFLTDIFHPNIVPPHRGGWVCIKTLDEWDFSSNLKDLIQGIESLLTNPNPFSPYRDETTIEAARYFLKNPYKPPKIIDE